MVARERPMGMLGKYQHWPQRQHCPLFVFSLRVPFGALWILLQLFNIGHLAKFQLAKYFYALTLVK